MNVRQVQQIVKVASLSTALLLSSNAFSHQVLNQALSSLNFLSTKNINVTEQHSFDKFSGEINADNMLTISVDLSSVNTVIPIRNERMRDMLFDVVNFPAAIFSAELNDKMTSLSLGERMTATVQGTLTLKDDTTPVSIDLVLVGLKDGAIQATTRAPIVLNAAALGVEKGVEALQKIAMLESISNTVPVTFSVVFDPHTDSANK